MDFSARTGDAVDTGQVPAGAIGLLAALAFPYTG
jgi:hypothetical protein